MYTLITGGAGYIGSHVAKLMKGPLVVIDDLSHGDINNCKYGTFIKADITNIPELENVFKNYTFSTVIHIAGKAFVQESFSNIEEYYNVNVVGTINVLNMMVKYNVPNIIFSSSCSVYGNVSLLPITENTARYPISPYGTTKKLCEDIIMNYSKVKNIKYIILRYFNVSGNDTECEVRDTIYNRNRLIPTIINCCLNNEVLTINGNTYFTKDGTCVRNYIHVMDLANAHIKALNFKYENLICNVGTPDNYSIIEIINIVEKILNKKINYIFKDKIQGDPDIVYCSNELAKNKLKLEIKYNIFSIITSYIAVFK